MIISPSLSTTVAYHPFASLHSSGILLPRLEPALVAYSVLVFNDSFLCGYSPRWSLIWSLVQVDGFDFVIV